MISEALEYQIAQYADGTLPAAEVAALEQVLAADAEARALLDEYRRLDATLKRELPVPAMNWERLAAHLSEAVADEDRATTTIAWPLRHAGKIAAAAAIIVAIGTMALWHLEPAAAPNGGTVVVNIGPPPEPAPLPRTSPTLPNTAVATVEVTGPAAEAATQPAIAQIDIGPSPWAKQTNFAIAEQVVYHPPRVMIASGPIDRQDTSRLPF